MSIPNRTTSESNPTISPRLVCRVIRQGYALLDRRSGRHAAACPDCQEYFRLQESLETSLGIEARASRQSQPSTHTLEQNILRAVRQSQPEPEPARSRSGNRGWIVSGLAAAAAVAIAVVSIDRRPELVRPTREVARANPSEDATVLVDAVQSISSGLTDSVIPSAGAFVAQNPMQQELGSVYSDVRSALDFLALNFLPTSTSARTQPPSQTI
jgi:hypothetical protein